MHNDNILNKNKTPGTLMSKTVKNIIVQKRRFSSISCTPSTISVELFWRLNGQ